MFYTVDGLKEDRGEKISITLMKEPWLSVEIAEVTS